MTKNPIYWMFIVLLCVNGYQQFMVGIVLSAIPLIVYLFKKLPFSRREAGIWLVQVLAAMVATVYSLFL